MKICCIYFVDTCFEQRFGYIKDILFKITFEYKNKNKIIRIIEDIFSACKLKSRLQGKCLDFRKTSNTGENIFEIYNYYQRNLSNKINIVSRFEHF